MVNCIFMKRYRAILFLLLLFSGNRLFSQSLLVDAPGVVEMGETFQIIYKASAQPASFNGPDFGKLEVLVGPMSSTLSSTQIINGKRTDSFEVNYTYTLQASEEGRYSISPASMVVGGKTYYSKSIVIEVVKGDGGQKSSSQKSSATLSEGDIFLRTTVDKHNAVKGELITATIKLYTKVAIGGFEDVKFPTFNGFWSQEIDTPQSIEFQRENIGGKIYNSALIKKYILVPQQTGNLVIDPAEMITQVQLRSGNKSGSMFDEFFESYSTIKKRLRSSAIKISVASLPGNAPKSFTGGVGDFRISSSLSKDSVNANEAVSVILKITGTGNINLVEKPVFNLPSEFESYDVKISDDSKASGRGIVGTKQFEFPFIPRNPGTYSIPEIEFTYYDISKRKYTTLTSGKLTLIVGKDMTGGAGNASALQPGVNKQAVKNIGSDISYIKRGFNLSKKNHFFFGSIYFFFSLIGIFIIYFVASKVLKKKIEMRKDIAGIKNRKANKVARARLNKAESLLKHNMIEEFYEELHRALLGYSSDKLTLNIADLSKDNIKESLELRGVKSELISSLLELLDACEYARYSPDSGSGGMELNYKKAIELISEMEA